MSATKAFSIVLIEAWANLLISQDYVRNAQREDASVSIFPPLCRRRSGVMWPSSTVTSQPGRAPELLVVLHIVPHCPRSGHEGSHEAVDWGHCLHLGYSCFLRGVFSREPFPPCLWGAVAELDVSGPGPCTSGAEIPLCCMCGRDRGSQESSGSPGPVSDSTCVGGTAGT